MQHAAWLCAVWVMQRAAWLCVQSGACSTQLDSAQPRSCRPQLDSVQSRSCSSRLDSALSRTAFSFVWTLIRAQGMFAKSVGCWKWNKYNYLNRLRQKIRVTKPFRQPACSLSSLLGHSKLVQFKTFVFFEAVDCMRGLLCSDFFPPLINPAQHQLHTLCYEIFELQFFSCVLPSLAGRPIHQQWSSGYTV